MVISSPLVIDHGGLGALYVFDVMCTWNHRYLEISRPVAIISPKRTAMRDSENQFGKNLHIYNENGNTSSSVIVASSPYEDGSLDGQINRGVVYIFREVIFTGLSLASFLSMV